VGVRNRRPRLARSLLAAALPALVLAWLAVSASGVYRYVNNYWLYRGFPPPHTAAGIPAGRQTIRAFRSAALGQRRQYLVYTPPGYRAQAAAGRRFPVLYLLHAPPGRPEGFFLAGNLQPTLDLLVAQRHIAPFLVVEPFGKSAKYGSDTGWADAGAGRYESFVLEVVRQVDRHYATLARRQDRAIAGISEGGYGATNIALRNLRVFATFESWSGYFSQTPTLSFTGASRAELRTNSPIAYVSSLAGRIRRYPVRAFVYQGRDDAEMQAREMRRFAVLLRRAGGSVGSAVYGGGHDWRLWRQQTPHMLRFAAESFTTLGRPW